MTVRTGMTLLLVACSLAGAGGAAARSVNRFDGIWTLQKEKSTNIDPWEEWSLQITNGGSSVTMIKDLRAGRYGQKDTMHIIADGKPHEIPMHPGKWLENVHLAVYGSGSAVRTVVATSTDSTLQLRITEKLQTEQGEAMVVISQHYSISADNTTLTMDETRSSRTTGPSLHYVFSLSARQEGR